MNKIKALRIVYWILFVTVFLVFWFSMRYAGDQAMEFTLLALLIWGLAFGLNKYVKRLEKKEEEEEQD